MADPTTLTIKANLYRPDLNPATLVQLYRGGYVRMPRVLYPIRINRELGGVATAELLLDNHDGLIARDNDTSSWNYDAASAWDPLLDENRILDISLGYDYFPNVASGVTVTVYPTPTAGSGTLLVDQTFAEPTSYGDAKWVTWGNTDFAVNVHLGASYAVKGVGISLGSAVNSGRVLPSSIQLMISTVSSGGPWLQVLGIPINFHKASEAGQSHYVSQELDEIAQWVRLQFYTGSGYHALDEVEVIGGDVTSVFRRKLFSGRLGDDIQQHADGTITLSQIRDRSKRMTDLFCEKFRTYKTTSNSTQVPDRIVQDILSNAYYGLQITSANYQLDATSFGVPEWSNENENLWQACQRLANMIGWTFEYWPEDNKYHFYEPEYQRTTGEEVLVSGKTVRDWTKTVTSKDMRNRVTVRFRTPLATNPTDVTRSDSDSIARYGLRHMIVEEPTIRGREQAWMLATAVLRDYSQIARHGEAVMDGDPYLKPGQVVTAIETWATASVKEHLYRIRTITDEITQSDEEGLDWKQTVGLESFRFLPPMAVSSLYAVASSGSAVVYWKASQEPNVIGYYAYIANTTTAVGSRFADVATLAATASPLSNGTMYWFRVAAYCEGPIEGALAGPVGVTPQSGPAQPPVYADEQWQPRSLSATVITSVAGTSTRVVKLLWYNPPQTLSNHYQYLLQRSIVNTLAPVDLGTKPVGGAGGSGYGPGAGQLYYDYDAAVQSGGLLYYRVSLYSKTEGWQSMFSNWAVASLA